MATLSFHETKNVTCGEGGALLVNDRQLIERAEIIREKGTNRSRFFRGEVDKYTWVDIGSSYVLSDLLAAFLLGQLEAKDEIQGRRRALFERYEAGVGGVGAPPRGRHARPAAVVSSSRTIMYYLRLSDEDARTQFIASLRSLGILAVSHYVPLHLSAMGLRYGYAPGDLPVTERVSGAARPVCPSTRR